MSSRWHVIALTLVAIALNFFPGLVIDTWGFHAWPRWDPGLFLLGFVPSTAYFASLLLLAIRWQRGGLILTLANSAIVGLLNSWLLASYWIWPTSEKLFWKTYPGIVIAVNAALCLAVLIAYRRLTKTASP